MDNLTHSLFGWTLARAGVGCGVPRAAATLVIASNLPDIDIFAGLRSSVDYLAMHRGPTHGPIGVVGLGLLTAVLVALPSRTTRHLARLWGVAMIGVTCHILMDLPTSYGTRLLSPFDWTWYALDWMPIIDVYLWIVLIAALAIGAASGYRRRGALAPLAFMTLDYSGRALLHERALADGARVDASGAVSPCGTAPTLVTHSIEAQAGTGGSPGCTTAAALPTFVSPFTWRIVRRYADVYELSDRGFAGTAPSRAIRVRTDTTPDVQRVRDTRDGRVYFDFARFPIAEVISNAPAAARVRLSDARFLAILPGGREPPGASGRLSIVVTVPGQ